MTSTNDISFRPDAAPTPNASARHERGADNAFADILRTQNAEREPASEPRDDAGRYEDTRYDDARAASADKPAPRQATKDSEATAKPRAPEKTNEHSSDKAEAPPTESKAKPKAPQNKNDDETPPAQDTPAVENAVPAAAALPVQVAPVEAAPFAPAAVAAQTNTDILTNALAAAVPAPVAAPVAPTAPKATDIAALGATKPVDALNVTPPAVPAAPTDAGDAATPDFDQLLAAAKTAAVPQDTQNAAPTPDSRRDPVSAAPNPAAAAPNTKPSQVTTQPTAAATTTPAAQLEAATSTPATATVAAAMQTDLGADAGEAVDETEVASLAALVTRPAAPRAADTRPAPTKPTDVAALPEPLRGEAAPLDTPAPRNGAGMLTAATGLAAQVKGQELQGAPQPGIEAQAAANAEKQPIETTVAKTSPADSAPKADRETANTPSTARPSDGQAPLPTNDTALRGTSFADSLAAARGSRANANPLVAQVAVHVAKAVSEGNDRITIKLSPADLGRIDVRLEIGSDGRIQAVFAADKPGTVDMLQRDARELERALQDAGLRADSGSLSFNLRGEQRDNAPQFAGNGTGRSDIEPAAELPAAAAQIYSGNTGGNGRLDIHV